MKHLHPRQPKKTAGFSWGRSVRDGAVTYRLFRRDQLGKIHCKQIVPNHAWPRYVIAYEINRARHALRDQVDEVDLRIMGITS